MMKTYIHVLTSAIKDNAATGNERFQPVIVTRTYWTLDTAEVHRGVILLDENGKEVARVVYMPEGHCHAAVRCWIETDCKVVGIDTEK